MGWASYLVYKAPPSDLKKTALSLYFAQLALNLAYCPPFFVWHRFGLASGICVGLWQAIGYTGIAFYSVNRTAGLLMIPYYAWVTAASYLTLNIWKMNPKKEKGSAIEE